jgi:pyruvate formate lyase activating enzyme
LLIPGYIDEEEIRNIARFIASIDPEIPYSLLAFYPNYMLTDLPPTSRSHANRCIKVAKEEGLRNVHLGNSWLLGDYY